MVSSNPSPPSGGLHHPSGGLHHPSGGLHHPNSLHFTQFSQSLSASWWRSWQRHWHSGIAFFLLAFTLLAGTDATAEIIQDYRPLTLVAADKLVSQSFYGNQSHVDYFRLLQRDGASLLIGARNFVYNVSIYDLTEHIDRRIEWVSRQRDSDVCFSKGKSEAECHNYIRVLAKKEEGTFLVCGTNAYKPICRDYSLQINGSFLYEESSGVGRCPYNPQHNSTFVFSEGDLYAGTVVDFQGTIPMIIREPLKTDHSDYRQLNGPDFVHSFEYGDYVFFFFRETAVEYMNCGKRVYSRVARVCKGDKGVQRQRASTMSTWTTFLKSRLNCSFPGEFPFYFDEIQSVSDVVSGTYGGARDEVIYAIFTTPPNSIPGSAVCAFSMRDILDTFDGPFKEQKDLNSNWLPVPLHRVPEPRPGSCVNDSQALPQEIINFVRAHPLMDELVSPFLGHPIITKASFQYRFTKLAVDPQVPLLTGGHVDVLFIATDAGMIFKVINAPLEESIRLVSPIILEEITVFEKHVSINNLQIAKLANGDKLIIITDIEVKAIPLQRCNRVYSCGECIALQDPYCGWYPNLGVCKAIEKDNIDTVLQNVSSGRHQHCPYNNENSILANPSTQIYTTEPPSSPTPDVEIHTPCVCPDQPSTLVETPQASSIHPLQERTASSTNDGVDDTISVSENEIGSPVLAEGPLAPEKEFLSNFIPVEGMRHPPREIKEGRAPSRMAVIISETTGTGPVVGASVNGPLIYSAETLAIAVTTACVAALVVGFISGFLFSRRCRGDDFPHFSETPYLDSKLSKCENTADPNMYTANNASLPLGKQINNFVVTNFNNKNVNHGKSNANNAVENKLIKPAKCAYI